MGTPMAPNYSNIFMDKIEQAMIDEFHKKTGLKPLVWFRYIDDIFFIWTHGQENFGKFVEFAQNYSVSKNMKSTIKYEVNQSTNQVNFLDVTIKLCSGVLSTSIYSKPTDAHIYLNPTSSHPSHVIKNIPKGQFTRLRRICSDTLDFIEQSRRYMQYFIDQGYNKEELLHQMHEVTKMSRDDLLQPKQQKQKDPSMIFVTTWHPKLSGLPKMLRSHFHHLQNSENSKLFTELPTVAFKRMKTLGNIIIRNDVTSKEKSTYATLPCNQQKTCRKMCKLINTNGYIVNDQNERRMKLPAGGDCTSRNVIYAARCKIHNQIYIGHTGDQIKERFHKHRYDAKSRPDNSELAEHFSTAHNFDNDIDVTILKHDLPTKEEREYHEDRMICFLGTKNPTGINQSMKAYGREVYAFAQKLIE